MLLISLDTLRRDRLGAYIPGTDTTPNLDAFAAKGFRFNQAYSHHPWTLPAHASILSGLYPSVLDVGVDRAMNDAVQTLPEIFGGIGYQTFGLVDNCKWLAPKFGFEQGFDEYAVKVTNAAEKVEAVLAHLDSLTKAPFFGFVHFFDAHSDFDRLPYDSRADFQDQYAGWYEGNFDGSLPDQPDWGHSSNLLQRLNDEGRVLEGDDRRYLASLYDAGVRTLDASLGELFHGLEQRGLFDNTIVVIVSDHGEEFFEHGHALHNGHFDELIRVPLLLRVPSGSTGVSDAFVGHVDLAPSLLELAGVAIPGDMQGRSIAPVTRGEALENDRDHVLTDNGSFLGLRSAEEAAISGLDGLRYHLAESDPQQLDNLIAHPQHQQRVLALTNWLTKQRAEMAPLRARFAAMPGSVELDEGELSDLAKLGYLHKD